jgi:osmotically-inducible protein OsmY
MKITPVTTGKALSVFGLILSLGAMPLLLGLTGCATSSPYEQSSGQRVDDQATSSRVKAALGDDTQYKYGAVNVETIKGTVQLSGFVNSRDQKNRAGDLAKNVPGVKQVANNITVQESAN